MCTGTTPACGNTCARGAGIHGDVLNPHTGFFTFFSACRNTHTETHKNTHHNDTQHTTPHGDRETETDRNREGDRKRDRKREPRKDETRKRSNEKMEEERREKTRQEKRRSREEKIERREERMKFLFLKNVSRPSNPPDELAQNVSKKSPSELFLHVSWKVQNLTVFSIIYMIRI